MKLQWFGCAIHRKNENGIEYNGLSAMWETQKVTIGRI